MPIVPFVCNSSMNRNSDMSNITSVSQESHRRAHVTIDMSQVNEGVHDSTRSDINRSNKRRNRRRGKSRDRGNSEISVNNGLNIAFNNVNRVKHKVYDINMLLNKEDIDVMGIAETFLKYDDIVNINNFRWFGKNRCNKGGGGIGFIVSHDVDVINDNLLIKKLTILKGYGLRFALLTAHFT